jgi:hypothetical protein
MYRYPGDIWLWDIPAFNQPKNLGEYYGIGMETRGTLLTKDTNTHTYDYEMRKKNRIGIDMPRGPRLDAPGTLHHVIVRGIEKRVIVDGNKDRKDFVTRMSAVALKLINEYGVLLAETARRLAYQHPVWCKY